MTNAIAFDTHAFVKRMKKVGMPEEQAEALAQAQVELIEERVATKRDLKELEASLKRDMKDLEMRMKELEMRMTLKMGSMLVVAVIVLTALVKVL